MIHRNPTVLVLALTLGTCAAEDREPEEEARAGVEPSAAERPSGATLISRGSERLSPEELERGRLDAGWKRVVQLDTMPAADSASSSETWEQISAQSVNGEATHLPLFGDVAGPSVLKTQILLDRILFSPGVIDGRWGKNTEKALFWLQRREELRATGRVDRETFDRLVQLAGQPQQLVRPHQLTAEDVEGPFVEVPEDIYAKAGLECMCYESLAEKLAETFHTTPELLAKLNPGVSLDGLQAGQTIQVPNVRDGTAEQAGGVDRLVVSDGGFYLHALDAQGRILYHFPTTLGSDYSPSPSGDFRVTNIAPDPTWHYQPDILHGVPDDDEEAIIPPGPNNAVGVVWMALSKPHYGIHGTSAPETIGYTTSNGCVRLTNWDARFLSQRIEPGVPVEFRDVDNPGSSGP
jgi:lipoprotein-anchoring transpeptidase ErfK/SrfK